MCTFVSPQSDRPIASAFHFRAKPAETSRRHPPSSAIWARPAGHEWRHRSAYCWQLSTYQRRYQHTYQHIREMGWHSSASSDPTHRHRNTVFQPFSGCNETARPLLKPNDGRGDRIRTCDPLFPKQMRYQAAPLPDAEAPSVILRQLQ